MAKAAKVLVLIAVSLTVDTAQAADPTTSIAPGRSGSRPEPHTAPDDASLFRTHCAMCHKPAELARRLQSAADPEAARADMAAFLARHGRSDANADAAIIDFLSVSKEDR